MNAEWYNQRPKYTGPESAAAFLAGLVEFVGAGFHPDTPFAGYYVEPGPGADPAGTFPRLFTDEQAAELDAELDAAMAALARVQVDPYEVALNALNRLLSKIMNAAILPREQRRCTYPHHAEAWHRGYEAAYGGLGVDRNPYSNYSAMEATNGRAWKDGHRTGLEAMGRK